MTIDTLELDANGGTTHYIPWLDGHAVRLNVGSATHTGHVRSVNQDARLIARSNSRSASAADDLASGAHVLAVADGMGGKDFGEVASQSVVQTELELLAKSRWFDDLDATSMDVVREHISAHVDAYATALSEHPSVSGTDRKMGTTWTAAYVKGSTLVVAHIGDSRAYLLRDGHLRRLTVDHTIERRLLERGIDPQEARRYRHALSRYLGSRMWDVEFDLLHTPIRSGDVLLLCTDGLTDMVPESEIALTLRWLQAPRTAARQLVRRALDHGGKDNVTAIVAAVEPD